MFTSKLWTVITGVEFSARQPHHVIQATTSERLV